MSKMDDCSSVYLPPGFRFHPTDEEIITHHLVKRIKNPSFSATAIGEADLNKSEPWDLPGLATMGEKEWYFFCQRDRKYPTGMRTNRATKSGYWKATGKDKEIFKGMGCLVGMKKTLVFYKGRAPKGEKTNWVMHEYRLEGKFSYWNLPKSAKDEWVVCRVFLKNTGLKRNPDLDIFNTSTYSDDVSESTNLPPLRDSSPYFINTTNIPNSTTFTNSNSHGEHFHGFHAGASTSTQSYISEMGLTTNVYDNSMNYYQPSYCKMEQYTNQTSSAMSTSPESSSVVSRQELGTSNNDYAHGQQNHLDFDYLLMNRYR